MKAFLIDPAAQTVEQVDYDGNFHSIYKLIDADTFDVVRLPHEDAIFVDDNGLLKDGQLPAFRTTLYGGALVGKGLVLGTDAEGESIEPRITLEALRETVSFGMVAGGNPPWQFVPLDSDKPGYTIPAPTVTSWDGKPWH